MVNRFEVWSIDLDPTKGHETKKIRPCVVVSPDVVNKYLKTVIIVPLTSTIKSYPTRVNCEFAGKIGQLMIDQIRAVDNKRLIKLLGRLDTDTCKRLSERIQVMFRY